MIQVTLNDIKIFPFRSKPELLEFIDNKNKLLIATNAEKLLIDNIKLKKIINHNIGYPDGVGAVLALKKKGYKSKKIPGVELWYDIIKKYHKRKTFYFIGSRQVVIEKTVYKIKKEFPGIKIENFRNGYLKKEDIKQLKKDLTIKKPDIVLVAMGSPKQEYFMDELLSIWPALYVGLGGSFDVYSGSASRAPKIMISFGLEWLYRLIKQPARYKRQLVLFKFFYMYVFNKL
ncbi:UDP-N-acetyl-D-mannosaminuronic acid transferase [Desulfosarcina ovata subsp. sediminis]|uniref:UDP-N-acetyl-D-mannosaminuronic acid transferase n=1 Tax=Desulfosarcina ovata subsp. sediminis TaxID=885957 RepID=A0A5K7ZKR4_9BACT|nr:WecB/TagA/CpsF family glycosyltransferase [Desulfosarcina ovata]BBO82762.1 UDP-N-acetyl-D-mannosaminuronic acid transferase [Desulfosarcina ovata subsp. sediminis]